MELKNLAAAILQCFGSYADPREPDTSEGLTNEETINLADWLQRESSINAWRSIQLAQLSSESRPLTSASGPISPIRQIK